MAQLPAGVGKRDHSLRPVQLEDDKHRSGQKKKERIEQESGYGNYDAFDKESEDSDMEDADLRRSRPQKAAKALPVSTRREEQASQILDEVMMELKGLDATVSTTEADELSVVSDPHEFYLSSEEDASLSDDYEDGDSLVDFEASPSAELSSKPSSRASSQRSQEDTARIVSFTLVTKPQIVQIVIQSPTSQKRQSMHLETRTTYLPTSNPSEHTRRPLPLKLYPSARRMSLASTISTTSKSLTYHSNHSLTDLPPRKSSKLANLSSLMTTYAKPSFLSSDPFTSPSSSFDNPNSEEHDTPRMPKTPTSMAAAAFKNGLSRARSRARNASLPKVSLAYTPGVVKAGVMIDLKDPSWKLAKQLAMEESREREEERRMEREREEERRMERECEEKALYEEFLIRGGSGSPLPSLPSSPKERERERGERKINIGSKMGFGMGLARRKSVSHRAKGDGYSR